MPVPDLQALSVSIVGRLQEAVADGELEWAGAIGDEAETDKAPAGAKVPGAAVLFKRAQFGDPQLIDVMQQTATLSWSVFAAGQNLREKGMNAGRLGSTGAYHAIMAVLKYLCGYEVVSGIPLRVEFIEIASFNSATGRTIFEVGFTHEWTVVQDGYE